MKKTMGLSGAESLAAAANIFIGQTEAPLVVKPYLEKMTPSEIMSLMIGGMATIAGGVLAAFITMLGGDDMVQKAEFTKHFLTASIISAPAAIICAKIIFPQTQEINKDLTISKDRVGTNFLDAIANGTTDGLRLAVNVGAMLLVFTAIVAVFNWFLKDMIGAPLGLNKCIQQWSDNRFDGLTLEAILGTLLSPIAWLLGVPNQDILLIGQLLGEKTVLNEFYAYKTLAKLKAEGLLQYKSVIIATYALCGFANIASVGIQIGGIGALAPNQRATLAKFGIKAMIGGSIASFLTAIIAGLLI